MIGNLFSKLFNFLIGLLQAIGGLISDAVQTLMDFLYNFAKWLGNLLSKLVQALIDVLTSFFMVIYDLIRGVLYLLYKIGVLGAKLFMIIWDVATLLWSFVVGLTKTFQSVFFAPGVSAGHGYSSVMSEVASSLSMLQLDVIAYILLFAVWLFGAFGLIKIFSTLRG